VSPPLPRLLLLALALLLTGCGGTQARRERATTLATESGWSSEILVAGPFDLQAAWNPGGTGTAGPPVLTVYLEGDGRAFLDTYHPSSDPTPTDPLALRLALADWRKRPQAAVAYLGRPCQYVLPEHGRGCETALWTQRRYAPEVVDSLDQALDLLKQRTATRSLILVGYSGGGALATLLAAQRQDVTMLITVAANLDLDYWLKRDGLSPLTGSIDPATVAGKLGNLPQVHFMGGRDKVVGADVTRAFLAHLPTKAPVRLIEVPDFTHECCWVEGWSSSLWQGEIRGP